MALTNLFIVSLAYQAAVTPLMLKEANFYANRLGLHEPRPITMAEAVASVNSPFQGLGHLETRDFFYSFPGNDEKPFTNGCGLIEFREHGKLAYILKKDPVLIPGTGNEAIRQPVGNVPQIDTNGAYHLAKEWLKAIDVDVARLEQDHKALSVQQECYDPPLPPGQIDNPPANAAKRKRPIFDVTWGGSEGCSPPVWIQILGTTKELLLLRMEDTRYSRRRPIVVTNALALNGLPEPTVVKGRRPSIGDLLRISQAYSNAATALMLKEANFFAERLNLALPLPLTSSQISARLSSPICFRELGVLEAKDFEFRFPQADDQPSTNEHGCVHFIEFGKLASIEKIKALKAYQNESGDFDQKFFELTPSIDSNGAYQLATQWLASVDVDLQRLEKQYRPASVQAGYRTQGPKAAKRRLPVFNVTWGGPIENHPPVSVRILGTTKELLDLRIEDTRFSRRRAIVITNALKLNSEAP